MIEMLKTDQVCIGKKEISINILLGSQIIYNAFFIIFNRGSYHI